MTAVFLISIGHGSSIIFPGPMVFSQILKDLQMGKVSMFLAIPLLFNKILQGILKGIREKGIVLYGIIRGLMSLYNEIDQIMVRGYLKDAKTKTEGIEALIFPNQDLF